MMFVCVRARVCIHEYLWNRIFYGAFSILWKTDLCVLRMDGFEIFKSDEMYSWISISVILLLTRTRYLLLAKNHYYQCGGATVDQAV